MSNSGIATIVLKVWPRKRHSIDWTVIYVIFEEEEPRDTKVIIARESQKDTPFTMIPKKG